MDLNPEIDEFQQWHHRIKNKCSSKGVTDIWQNNIERLLVPIIDSNESFAEKLSTIHKTNLFTKCIKQQLVIAGC